MVDNPNKATLASEGQTAYEQALSALEQARSELDAAKLE